MVIYTNEIWFEPGQSDILPDGRVIFEYVVAEDYVDTIALVEAEDMSRHSAKLKVAQSSKSIAF